MGKCFMPLLICVFLYWRILMTNSRIPSYGIYLWSNPSIGILDFVHTFDTFHYSKLFIQIVPGFFLPNPSMYSATSLTSCSAGLCHLGNFQLLFPDIHISFHFPSNKRCKEGCCRMLCHGVWCLLKSEGVFQWTWNLASQNLPCLMAVGENSQSKT